MADTQNTTSLADLLAEYDVAEHDHAVAERNSGMQHIHNHANGDIVWFPTWQKNRETTDWETAVQAFSAELEAAAGSGADAAEAAAALASSRLQALLEQAAEAPDANVFIRENLALLRRVGVLADGRGELLHRGGGLLQRLGLRGGAQRQRLVVAGDLRGVHGHVGGAGAHLRHHGEQAATRGAVLHQLLGNL